MQSKPFTLLIKPTSADCNLRCTYCFYLCKSGLYPESRLHRMSEEVLESMISGYLSTEQPVYSFGWQGGEPTLMGLDFYKKAVELQEKYGKGKAISNSLQSNGILIDDEFAKFLAEYNFLVGISLDGPADIHNRYRNHADGSDTHHKVLNAIESLRRNKTEFNILTLVNKANVNRGREVYQYLLNEGFLFHQYIPCVEFDEKGNLLPFAITGEEWGRFLCDVYDEWYKNDTTRVSVRLFDAVLNHMIYGAYTVCHMGGNCCQYFVVEHNGDIYPCDFYVEKELKLGSLLENSWSEMQNSDKYHSFGRGKADWNKNCTSCEYLTYCSGDCMKHRAYSGNELSSLSWLCKGWKMFYNHTLEGFRRLAEYHVRKGNIPAPERFFVDRKFNRNDQCYCGSLRKYKKCHGFTK
ncbi:MAG: anaerobic sulfatase maturase [Caldicoprobacterales bacterium]|jgi:uncharacterized protein